VNQLEASEVRPIHDAVVEIYFDLSAAIGRIDMKNQINKLKLDFEIADLRNQRDKLKELLKALAEMEAANGRVPR